MALDVCKEFLTQLKLCKNLRPLTEDVDGTSVEIAVLLENLNHAIDFYSKNTSDLPNFIVIRGEEFLSQIEAARSANKRICFFSPRVPAHELLNIHFTILEAISLGFDGDYLIDLEGVFFEAGVFAQQKFKENFFVTHLESIISCYNLLSDDHSKHVFMGGLKSRLVGYSGYLPFRNKKEYFHDFVTLNPGDVVYEAGIGRGAEITSLDFSREVGENGKVFAFEANPNDWSYLESAFSGSSNIFLERCGLWSSKTQLRFLLFLKLASRVCGEEEEGGVLCDFITLDSHVFSQPVPRCDFIKFDIEGAELEALRGAINTLRHFRPKLAIAIYHDPPEQFVEIFEFLAGLQLGYKFYMEHHSLCRLETVLYATPA